MERKIGEIFKYNGEWYQCMVATLGCKGCSFRTQDDCTRHFECLSRVRSDKTSVIFKKLEKVGEPFSCNYYGGSRLIMMQEYQLFDSFDSNVMYCYQTPRMYITDYKHKRIAIEIEQNKEESMKEKKVKLLQEEYDYIRNKIKMVILPGNLADDVDSDDLGSEIMKLFSIDEKLTKIETNGTCFNNYKKEDCHTKEFYVEVKQNKEEDMEEKKTNFIEKLEALCKRYYMFDGVRTDFISEVKEIIKDKEECNFKPFNLKEAKLGKPVCTRDGRKARIICFDAKGKQPIIALFEREKADEVIIQTYNDDGSYYGLGKEDNRDLMMLPEKKEGWVNVYREESNNNERLIEQTIYKTRKDAFDNACPKGYITTTKINWEE